MKRNKTKKTVIRILAMLSAALIMLCMLTMLAGCAAAETGEADEKSTKYATIYMPNGEKIEGEVEDEYRWTNGMIELIIDGVSYRTHIVNVLISK